MSLPEQKKFASPRSIAIGFGSVFVGVAIYGLVVAPLVSGGNYWDVARHELTDKVIPYGLIALVIAMIWIAFLKKKDSA